MNAHKDEADRTSVASRVDGGPGDGPAFLDKGSRKALLILAMPCSGGSALAGALTHLGFQSLKRLLESNDASAREHGESTAITSFNDVLLASQGSRRDRWNPLESGWNRKAAALAVRERIPALVSDQFGKAPLFLLKDSGLCRTAPLWLDALTGIGIVPKVIIPVGNPFTVARSLQQRDGTSHQAARLLWLRHMLDAESATRVHDRTFVLYEALVNDPVGVLKKLIHELGLPEPRPVEECLAEVEALVAPLPRNSHSDHETGGSDRAAPDGDVWESEVYDLLGRLSQAQGEKASIICARLDDISREFNAACSGFEVIANEAQISSDLRTTEAEKLVEESQIRVGANQEDVARLRQEQEEMIERHALEQGQLAEKISLLQELRAEMKSEMAHLHQQLANARQEQQALGALREEEVARMRDRVTALEAELHNERQAKDGELARLEQAHADSIASMRSELASARELNAEMTQAYQAQLGQLRQARSRAEASIQERFGEIARVTRQLIEAQGKLSSADAALKKMAHDVGELKVALSGAQGAATECEKLREAVAGMEASRSWRWTAWLRGPRLRARRIGSKADPLADVPGLIARSGLFDAAWYLARYPDVARDGTDPIEHYLSHGAAELRDPGPRFSTSGYLKKNPDVAEAGIVPLVHFVTHGRDEGREAPASE